MSAQLIELLIGYWQFMLQYCLALCLVQLFNFSKSAMLRILLYLHLILPIILVFGNVPEPLTYRPSGLAAAASHVLQKHVCSNHSTLAIIELFQKNETKKYEQDELLTHLVKHLGTEIAVQLLQDKPIERAKDHTVFLVDTAEKFQELRFHFVESQFDNEFTFLILFMGEPLEVEIMDIFQTCFDFHVLNVILLVVDNGNGEKENNNQNDIDDDDMVLIYGYRLFGPLCNEMLTIQLLNAYKNGKMLYEMPYKNLFDRSSQSLYGCSLNISWYHLPPFVIFNGDSKDPVQLSQSWRLSGIDGDLLKMLAKIFDFHIQLRNPCDKCSQPDLNDICVSCLNELSNNQSNVAIGGLSASHLYRNFFSTTCAYYQSSLIFVIHMESKIGAASQLLMPFKRIVWLSLIFSCIMIVIVQWVWHGKRCSFDIHLGALYVLTTLLGNPIEERRISSMFMARFLLIIWLFMALVLRAAYQGKLYDVFRLAYNPPLPEEIADLITDNYTLIAHEYYDYYPHEYTKLTQMDYLRRFQMLEEEYESQCGQRLTVSALMANLAYYNQRNWQTSRLTHVKEPIYLYQLVMYLRRHSVLKFPFDRKLKQLMSSGIVGHINRLYDQSKYRTPQDSAYHEATTVPLITYCGLFTVGSILLTAAVMAFVLELLSLKFTWLRPFLE